jgi:hypothetical protein
MDSTALLFFLNPTKKFAHENLSEIQVNKITHGIEKGQIMEEF